MPNAHPIFFRPVGGFRLAAHCTGTHDWAWLAASTPIVFDRLFLLLHSSCSSFSRYTATTHDFASDHPVSRHFLILSFISDGPFAPFLPLALAVTPVQNEGSSSPYRVTAPAPLPRCARATKANDQRQIRRDSRHDCDPSHVDFSTLRRLHLCGSLSIDTTRRHAVVMRCAVMLRPASTLSLSFRQSDLVLPSRRSRLYSFLSPE